MAPRNGDGEEEKSHVDAAEWLSSEEGKKAIQDMLEQSSEMVTTLRKARYVDPNSLQEAVTL